MKELSEKPLQGVNVLVTRAKDQAESFAVSLEALGATCLEIPVIEISEPDDWQDFDRAAAEIEKFDWLIFASQNAVERTFSRLAQLGLSPGKIKGKIAAIGPSTAEVIEQKGLSVQFQPSSFVAENLIAEMPGYPHLDGLRVFWPKTDIGRKIIIESFSRAGATVVTAVVYKTGLPQNSPALQEKLKESFAAGKVDVITLASAQSARNLATLLHGAGLDPKALDRRIKIAAIGPVTAEAARIALGRVDIEAAVHTLPGLAEALLASLKIE